MDITLEEAKVLQWGTYGKTGKEKLRMVDLDECSSNHLANIAINIKESGRALTIPHYLEGIILILNSRKFALPEELFEI
jgi:hypothetical protein